MIELLIQNGNTLYQPALEEDVSWDTERKGQPGKLTFSLQNDSLLDFQEGNPVSFKVNGEKVFYGFIFKKDRDKTDKISVTAYDQLRYFKNKDTYVYKNKTASSLLQMLAADFRLQTGTIEDTEFVIASRVEDKKSLFDMVQNALDLTLTSKNKMFVLYDDFGKLCLRDVEKMLINLLIDSQTAENFKYSSSIDGETYNKIKLAYENKDTGKREIYIAQHGANMNTWGVLQYYDTLDASTNGSAKADALLRLYNQKERTLTIANAFGDIRVRGGCSIPVFLELGDVKVQNFMLVEKVKHTFSKDNHTMDLTLKGGGFIA